MRFCPMLLPVLSVLVGCGRSTGGEVDTPIPLPDGGAEDGMSGLICDTSRTANCRNDPPPTKGDEDSCARDATDRQCGGLYNAYARCTVENFTCGPDGRTIPPQGCTLQHDLWRACTDKADAGDGF